MRRVLEEVIINMRYSKFESIDFYINSLEYAISMLKDKSNE